MASLDFETRLDNALRRLAEGKSDDALREMPEASDLIGVAHQLQSLKPAPEPHLGKGRERFMAEAARLGAPARPQSLVRHLVPRPMLAFLTAFILLAGGMVFITVRTSMADWANTPSPTVSPTLTGTPTNAAYGRMDRIPALPTLSNSNRWAGMSRPEPAPTPNVPRVRPPSVETIILDWQLLNG